jgi:hypothetical protein
MYDNGAAPEQEQDYQDSGPFCPHWEDPSDCSSSCGEETGQGCGHSCHYWDCEVTGCNCTCSVA